MKIKGLFGAMSIFWAIATGISFGHLIGACLNSNWVVTILFETVSVFITMFALHTCTKEDK